MWVLSTILLTESESITTALLDHWYLFFSFCLPSNSFPSLWRGQDMFFSQTWGQVEPCKEGLRSFASFHRLVEHVRQSKMFALLDLSVYIGLRWDCQSRFFTSLSFDSEHISFQSSAIFAIEEEVRSSLSVLLSQFHSALFSLESSVTGESWVFAAFNILEMPSLTLFFSSSFHFAAHVLGEIKGSILAVDNVMGNIFIGLSGCLKGCVSGSLKGKFEALATVMARLHAKLKGSAGVSGGAGDGISGGICSAINGMLGGSFGVEAGIGGGVGFGVEADANVAGGVGGGLDL